MDKRGIFKASLLMAVMVLAIPALAFALNEDNPGASATGVSSNGDGTVTISWSDGTTSVWTQSWFDG